MSCGFPRHRARLTTGVPAITIIPNERGFHPVGPAVPPIVWNQALDDPYYQDDFRR
jgi:hypothetical protein